MKSEIYLLYRNIKAFFYSIIFYIMRVIPINNNRICFCAFEGRSGFCCNPKYLAQELHKRNSSYELYWLVNDMQKVFPPYIKKVKNTALRRALVLSTSKVWIDNYRNPYGTKKRAGQYYLNVNHYTIGIKSTGLWRGAGFSKMAYLVSRGDSKIMDALITDSVWCDLVSPKGMLFNGCFLRTGAPRCDVLYGSRIEAKKGIRRRYGLPGDAKICMYAPTFREGAKDGRRFVYRAKWGIDFSRLLHALARRFGGTWYLCLRVHPQLAASHIRYQDDAIGERIIDASNEDDMYELLAGMDAYITDYSSAVFEAGFCGMPAFLYMEDLQRYKIDRGSLMWTFPDDETGPVINNMEITPSLQVTLPFPVTRNNDALEESILFFDDEEYKRRLSEFYEAIELVFDGHASEKVADVVEKWINMK